MDAAPHAPAPPVLLPSPSPTPTRTEVTESNDAKIDLAKALKLRLVNKLTFQEIADQFKTSKQAIQQRLSRFTAICADPDILHAYQDSRPTLLSAVEEQMLQLLVDPAKTEKASLNNVAYTLTQVSQLRRLESGQSTSNMSAFVSLVIAADERLGKSPNKQIPLDAAVKNDETPIDTPTVEVIHSETES